MLRKLIHIRSRNQITIPEELVSHWNVGQGDYLRAYIEPDGKVTIAPARIAVEASPEAADQKRRAEEEIKAGDYRTFEDVNDFARFLEEENEEQKESAVAAAAGRSPHVTLRDAERTYILHTLRASNWNKRAAAKFITERLKKINIDSAQERVK